MLLVLVPDVDEMPVQQQYRLIDELFSLALSKQHGAPLVHQVRVQQLRLLVLLQSIKSIFGPAKSSHDQGELQPSLIDVRGEGNHSCVTLFRLLKFPKLSLALGTLQPNSRFAPPEYVHLVIEACLFSTLLVTVGCKKEQWQGTLPFFHLHHCLYYVDNKVTKVLNISFEELLTEIIDEMEGI